MLSEPCCEPQLFALLAIGPFTLIAFGTLQLSIRANVVAWIATRSMRRLPGPMRRMYVAKNGGRNATRAG